jgi:hypothetical protein
MDTGVIVAAISALTAIAVAAFTYLTTKEREREAEWRKEKFAQYKEYLSALAAMTGGQPTVEARKRYATAFNTVGMFASQDVIQALHAYQEITRLPAEKIDLEEHDRRLSRLVLAIRQDLKLKPGDDPATFSYKLIASGV